MQQGSLWLTKTHVRVHTFRKLGEEFLLGPGELIVLGDAMLQGDMLGWADLQWSPLGRLDLKLASSHQWVKVLMPWKGYMNRTYFNKDSLWLERVS